MSYEGDIDWDMGEEKPPEYWAELIGGETSEDSEDDNGASVVPAADASIREQIAKVQDMFDHDLSTDIDDAASGQDEVEKEESIVDEDKEVFEDTEFAILALDEDPEHVEIESLREPADDDYAFVLGDQTDSLEEVAEWLEQEKTIQDGSENWIPFGDVYRHPTTQDVEVRVMSEDWLKKLANAMGMSTKEVLEKLADQVGKYNR
ncbi:hypothetical protein QM012_002190 [Aureobasidium pullulans]|uniref:Uncharacterized protein n=1 Tax=Aureobasidium pullulans TaxID=5580 RepID=A0ABR0TCP4_AURPU